MEIYGNRKKIQDEPGGGRIEEIQPHLYGLSQTQPSVKSSYSIFSSKLSVPTIDKLKVSEPIRPDPSRKYANEVLFALSLAEYNGKIHALARGISRGENVSHILHGTMTLDGKLILEDEPIIDLKNREDPRITKIGDRYYFTHTVVGTSGKFSVGFASTTDFKNYEDHGIIIPPLDKYDAKDPVLFPTDGSEVIMLVRLKPGMQILRFGSIHELLERCRDSAFWSKFVEDYKKNPEKYDYLNPNMPEMQRFESEWQPIFDGIIYNGLLPHHPDISNFRRHPNRGKPWYGSGPAPIKTDKGWLEFPHRGELVGSIKGKGAIRFYCVFATLRDLEDPSKLIAVSRIPVSMPDPGNDYEMDSVGEELAVPFVKIATGSLRVTLDGKSYILVPPGVNDKYSKLVYLPEEESLDWMIKYGKV